MPTDPTTPLSGLEYHLLLAVARGPLHGYAIRDAVEHDSEGALSPRAGSLYRVIARLTSAGWLRETEGPDEGPHPGRERRYYGLTPQGREVLRDEAARWRGAVALAERRLGRP
ncbi:PadR family transcriptional regulator [Gaopeijia maritima]|uniref:Helix-turn-helix transcriptional regulator n=1 Tax=Gaopeijia maritima TaxID=3119007 RepID=A0ABU9ED74_9BACT